MLLCKECNKTEEDGWHDRLDTLSGENPWPHKFEPNRPIIKYNKDHGFILLLVQDVIPGDSLFQERDGGVIARIEYRDGEARFHYLRDTIPYSTWMACDEKVCVYPSPW